MLELRIISAGQTMPLFDLPAALGRSQAAREIGDTIEGLIAFMDELGGDPDMEDSETGSNMVDATGRYLGDDVPHGQDEDREFSWTEWQSRGGRKMTSAGHEMPTHALSGHQMCDDLEDDDPAEQDDEPEDGHDREEVDEREQEDPMEEFTSPIALAEQRDRVRHTLCDRIARPGYMGASNYRYRLRG